MTKGVDTINRLCNNSFIEMNNRRVNMSVNKFKVDDVVKCVDVGIFNNLTVGKEYAL